MLNSLYQLVVLSFGRRLFSSWLKLNFILELTNFELGSFNFPKLLSSCLLLFFLGRLVSPSSRPDFTSGRSSSSGRRGKVFLGKKVSRTFKIDRQVGPGSDAGLRDRVQRPPEQRVRFEAMPELEVQGDGAEQGTQRTLEDDRRQFFLGTQCDADSADQSSVAWRTLRRVGQNRWRRQQRRKNAESCFRLDLASKVRLQGVEGRARLCLQ